MQERSEINWTKWIFILLLTAAVLFGIHQSVTSGHKAAKNYAHCVAYTERDC
jgi:hypothetical protein